MTITAAANRIEPARPVRLRQLPGLDGLRAVAVVAVIVYHLDPSWLPGGYLGVDIFFVISGYLITSLILSEYQGTHTVSLRRFWVRRARRLLPALGVLLLAVTILAAAFARDALAPMQSDLPAAVGYVLNWHLLFEHDSYMASFGRPPLLQHLWSLSVEEQFYLVWPPLLIFLRRRMSTAQIAGLALAGAGLSAALMAGLFRPGTNPSAVYFGTHTHAEGLLLGCALAAAIPPWHMSAAVTARARDLLERAGLAAMVVVVAGLIVLGFDSSLTYRGGLLLVDLATTVVVATVAHPASRLGVALGRQPLRWIGLRSYSLYLWHWPIFEMTRPGVDVAWSTVPDLALRLALTVAAAELSYRYVEQPWREGRPQFALRLAYASMRRSQVVVAIGAPVALVALLLATAPVSSEPAVLAAGATAAARSAVPAPAAALPAPSPPHLISLPAPTAPPPWVRQPGLFLTFSPPTTTVPAVSPLAASEPILAVGDSVLLAASRALDASFGPAITVDAAVGRQVQTGLDRLAAYRAAGVLTRYRTVMVDLGTNGTFSRGQFAELCSILDGVPRVLVFDLHVPRPWAAADNVTLTQGAAAHPGWMTLVDWDSAAGAPGLLYSDGIHPDPLGAQVYTRLVQQALTRAAL